MPWVSTAVSVGGSLLGGMMGGSKAGERAAKDAAARANIAQEESKRASAEALRPYQDLGQGSARLLSEYLGTADPEGYAPRPTRQQFVDERRNAHFQHFGKDYNRNSNMGGVNQTVDRLYKEAMAKWEAGKKEYIKNNPGSQGDGRLLKDFTNEDFVRDPGYEARLMEGERGNFRSLAAGGNLASGKALKALERYRQDYASNEFGNAFNRDSANKSRTFGFLSSGAGTGLQASGMGINANQNAANAIGNNNTNAAFQVNQMQQNRQDNQSNAFQSALGNLIYGMERNKPVVGRTPDFNPNSSSNQPWYYSG